MEHAAYSRRTQKYETARLPFQRRELGHSVEGKVLQDDGSGDEEAIYLRRRMERGW